MKKNWINIRLERIHKKMSALETTLFTIANDLQNFLESKEVDELDTIIYGQESIEGVAELIDDIKSDIYLIGEQLNEQENSDIPDKI